MSALDKNGTVEGGSVVAVKRRPKDYKFARIKTHKKLPTLTHLAKKPLVNIGFENIQYSVNLGRGKGKYKTFFVTIKNKRFVLI